MRGIGNWRVGFEVEVILGDLGEPAFWDVIEPMDLASPRFCQIVARELSELTNERWSAPRLPVSRPGFYVIPEYDLDPLNWPRNRIAGVELLTPPLPIDSAQRIREKIVEAITEIDGAFNSIRSDHTEQCAWHINIDPIDEHSGIKPENFILFVDELHHLTLSDRLGSSYAAPQHHSYGIPLLRHLEIEPDLHFMEETGYINFLRQHSGRGKRYAANFAKLDAGYVELRHFCTEQFFNAPPLGELLLPIIAGFEAHVTPPADAWSRQAARYRELRSWMSAISERLSWDSPSPWHTIWCGKCYFDGKPLAEMTWNGSLDISVGSTREYANAGAIYDVQWPDIGRAIALLALDAADHLNAGRDVPAAANSSFRTAVSHLAKRLVAAPMAHGGVKRT